MTRTREDIERETAETEMLAAERWLAIAKRRAAHAEKVLAECETEEGEWEAENTLRHRVRLARGEELAQELAAHEAWHAGESARERAGVALKVSQEARFKMYAMDEECTAVEVAMLAERRAAMAKLQETILAAREQQARAWEAMRAYEAESEKVWTKETQRAAAKLESP